MNVDREEARRTAEGAIRLWGPMLRRSGLITLAAVGAWFAVYATGVVAVGWSGTLLIAAVGAMCVFYFATAFQFNLVVPKRVRQLHGIVDRLDLDQGMLELNTLIGDGREDCETKRRAMETLVARIELAAQKAVAEGSTPAEIEAYVAIELERGRVPLDAESDSLAPVLDMLERIRQA